MRTMFHVLVTNYFLLPPVIKHIEGDNSFLYELKVLGVSLAKMPIDCQKHWNTDWSNLKATISVAMTIERVTNTLQVNEYADNKEKSLEEYQCTRNK